MEERKLNRSEQRAAERVNSEAESIVNQMSEKFMNFLLMNEDPDEIQKKIKSFSNRWRLYCKSKGFMPKAYTILDDIMYRMVHDLENGIPVPEETPIENPEMKVSDETNI